MDQPIPAVPSAELTALVNAHLLPVDEVLLRLRATRTGLSAEEAAGRLLRFGANALRSRARTPAVILFLRQLANPLAYILLAAAVVKLLVIAAGLGIGVFLAETLRKLFAPRLFSFGKWKPVRWGRETRE